MSQTLCACTKQGRIKANLESSGCSADMAEGSAEEEQSSTAAPASPPADLRTITTHLSPSPYRRLQPPQPQQTHHRPYSNMLATAAPMRHNYNMLSHVKTESADIEPPCDVPLNLKSESIGRSLVTGKPF
ncbi:hypothetical protein KQX54_014985 [Cotesia glomerata]|uniref:Uncharacterized protein n=1 Tax=Cotesia glomerata TaxID=32391 RepID=A0AAV7ILL9_COTGL|nr:hypothetical protein KQX54_014985 [Cotesia glomerata]